MSRPAKKKTASATGQKGAVGENFVEGIFLKLGWGPVPVSKHDVGTDFFVQVRDEELTELGLLLGVQVKNEKGYFTSDAYAKAKAKCHWEYKAEQDDTEYWLDHAIPHVLVLYDRYASTAYWGRVARETVRWTSRAARIQIPFGNRLDLSSRPQLLHIAADARRNIAWSPAGWEGVASMPPARRLRTALLAPRVAAPRRVGNDRPLRPETAIARLMLGRFPGRPASSPEDLPSEEEQTNGTFAWRLHHAFWTYLKTGEPKSLDAVAQSATQSHERIALTAMRAAMMLEKGDPRAALTILDDADETDLVDPVDAAWLDAQRSRCLRELGDDKLSRDLALKVAATGLLHAYDHGAVALRAAVLNNMHLAVDSPPTEVQLAVSATDSPPVWWRDQHRAWALTEVLDREYTKWSGHASSDVRASTHAWDRLRGVTLSAGMNADHRAWCVAMSELARYVISISDLSETSLVTMCLDDLRNCGDQESVSHAVDRLILDGPVEPLRRLTQQIDAAACTRTNLTSTLEVFERALDVIEERTLKRHAHWVLHSLENPDELPKTSQSFTWIAKGHLLPTLRTAYRLLDLDSQALIRQHLVIMTPITDQFLAESYATLARSIPHDDWTPDELRALQPRAEPLPEGDASEVSPFGDHRSLGDAINGILAHAGDTDRLTALYGQLAQGNWQPLEDLGDLGQIPTDILRELIPHLIQDLDERADQAAKGMWTRPAIYSGEVLLIINCTHPSLARWDPIHRVLEGRSRWDQASLSRRLSVLGDLIDQDVAQLLEPALVRLADNHHEARILNPRADQASRLALLELTTRVDDPESLHIALSAGSAGRKAVARAVGRRRALSDLSLLTALATDSDSEVRAATAGAAIVWQQHDPQPAVQALLDTLLREGGYATAYAVMRAIRHEQHSQAVHEILDKLSAHPSASIRWRANQLIEDPENCRCGSV